MLGLKNKDISQIRVEKKDIKKLKQVFLYILEQNKNETGVEESKANILLYFIDFDYFEKIEENLMGANYIKNNHPVATDLSDIIKEMKKNGEIDFYFENSQAKYLPLKSPNLNLFSKQEIEHIDTTLNKLENKSTAKLIKHSQGDIPWLSAQNEDVISYGSVFYRDDSYSVKVYNDEL